MPDITYKKEIHTWKFLNHTIWGMNYKEKVLKVSREEKKTNYLNAGSLM